MYLFICSPIDQTYLPLCIDSRSAAARRRLQKRRTKGFLEDKHLPTFSPLSATQQPQIKRPKQSYLIHNITDRRASTYTCHSSMPTVDSSFNKPRHSLPMSTLSSKVSSLVTAPTIKESSTNGSARLDSSRDQNLVENTLSPNSTRRRKNTSKISPRIERPNTEIDVPSSAKVRVTKLPRKKQIAAEEDVHSSDSNIIPMRRNEVERTTRSSISSGRSSMVKKRQRSKPIDESTDNDDRSQDRSSRIGTVTVRKLKRLSRSVQPMPNHDQSKITNDHVKVTNMKKNDDYQ